MKIFNKFEPNAEAVIYKGSCFDFLKTIPDQFAKLVVTSPPYNIGKEYERKMNLDAYVKQQEEVIKECYRVLKPDGSICWQVGNYVNNGEIIPLDILLYPIFNDLGMFLRNRIIWHFEHGLHCKNRFSGRYETINWYTKTGDYTFNLDQVRVPQKYPNKKHFKGPNAGKNSCNPLGKNPGDLWAIPNVKNNHVEKTIHPCQFPVELIERLVLSMTDEGDWIIDPFLGVGSSIIAAIKNGRKGAGSEIFEEYVEIAHDRLKLLSKGRLRTRPMNKPVYNPEIKNVIYEIDDEESNMPQLNLFEKKATYCGN